MIPEESSGTSNPETIAGKDWTITRGYGLVERQITGVQEYHMQRDTGKKTCKTPMDAISLFSSSGSQLTGYKPGVTPLSHDRRGVPSPE
ncbi:MAG: hypothetical protein STSR0009_20510 [Methanoregula sp.]